MELHQLQDNPNTLHQSSGRNKSDQSFCGLMNKNTFTGHRKRELTGSYLETAIQSSSMQCNGNKASIHQPYPEAIQRTSTMD
ncbi:hypothetical protein GOBAR_DD32433 [Gossypium barbadense]|nr:hypothetical protein GOBAR_DD32433 [Gossypium barbadense]